MLLRLCSVLSLLMRPAFCPRVSLLALPPEPERAMVSQALKRLHKIFNIGDKPQNYLPHKKPPQFMVDLFNAVADHNGVTRNPRILEGNVVRSFEDRVYFDRKFHFFNLSSFSKSERMIKAEFRMFSAHFYKVDVYEVPENRMSPWQGDLISSRFLPLYNQGWEVFNVTKTVSKWIHNNDTNKGFLVVITLPSGKLIESQVRSGSEGKKSYLVIFSDDGRRGMPNLFQMLINLNTKQKLMCRGLMIHLTTDCRKLLQCPPENKRRKTRAAPYYTKWQSMTCQRQPLYVDFEKIGWSGWIISPRGYDAYHCKGSCPFPLGESLRATNHATVQSIVNALKLSPDVHAPCCVPDKLHSISLLYFDDEENVVLKQYDDMVVVSCGCH
uniref:TGF-beta family profile domain-containing protein n=1 Tax=Paramormyrops kingsleyae TaxID=1676925 RepID=A0A3B3T8I2_9TELE